jgi:O-antigen/teichoic acid export membrane protein
MLCLISWAGLILVSVVAFALAATLFWLWMLVDCALHEPSAGNDKLAWVLIIVLTHFLGALLYCWFRRPHRPLPS